MDLAVFLDQLGTGVANWLPTLARALVETFTTLFFTVPESGVATLNTLGSVCVAFFVIGLGFRCLPAVLGWLRAKWTARRGRKARRR